MAHITLSGVLLSPNGEIAEGDRVRFTHKSTTGQTVQEALTEILIPADGTYTVNLQYGLVLVEYKDKRKGQFTNLGVATVNQDNPATSIPELLNALVPVSSEELIEFQAILADCVAAADRAEAAAATIDGIVKVRTLSEAIADGSAKEGDVVIISDQGNGIFEYVPGLEVDGENIFDSSGVVGLQLIRRYYGSENVQLEDGRILTEFVEETTADIDGLKSRVSVNESDISALQAGQGAGTVGFATQALLYADLNYDDKTVAYVTNDTTVTNNGTYRKIGASGSGSWIQSSDDLASQAYQQSIESETYFEKNQRVLDLKNRYRFVAGEIDGAYYAPNLSDRPSLGWSITSDSLVFDGTGKSTYPEIFWTGHVRKLDRNTEIIMQIELDAAYSGGSSAGPGPIMYFGEVDLRGILFSESGRLFGVNGSLGGSGTYGQSVQDVDAAFGQGELVELRVVLRKDGTGFAIGTKLANGYSMRLDFTEDNLATFEPGKIWMGFNRDTASTISHFEVNELEVVPEDFNQEAIIQDLADVSSRLSLLEQANYERYESLTAPVGFSTYQDLGFDILKGLTTQSFYHTLTPRDYKLDTPLNTYVDPVAGDDSNDGSEEAPFATITKAFTEANSSGSTTITLAGGEYDFESTGTLPDLTVAVNIVCASPYTKAEITTARAETSWVQDGTYINLWYKDVVGAAPIHCYDKGTPDEYSTPSGLIERTQSDANDTPGSYYISGNRIYVRTHDNREPDSEFRVIRDMPMISFTNKLFYMENIIVRGGNDICVSAPSHANGTCLTTNCTFTHSINQAFRWVRNAGSKIITHNGEAAWSKINDGFSYTSAGSGTDMVELNCVGHHCGLENGSTHNGSTIHSSTRAVRINCTYKYNNNKNMADVSSGTQSWNLGVISGTTYGDTITKSNNYNVDSGASMWLDSCVSDGGSLVDFYIGTTSTMYMRNVDTSGKVIVEDGTLESY